MKKNLFILFSIVFFTGCPLDYYYSIRCYNVSDIDPICCVLDKCLSDSSVTAGSQYACLTKDCIYAFDFNRRPEKEIKDSIAIYFLNPEAADIDLYYGIISKTAAKTINNSPNLILATYIFSVKQLKALDWSYSFPPDEKMKELGVLTIPSYEELNEKYRK